METHRMHFLFVLSWRSLHFRLSGPWYKNGSSEFCDFLCVIGVNDDGKGYHGVSKYIYAPNVVFQLDAMLGWTHRWKNYDHKNSIDSRKVGCEPHPA
jgi:hypothetical protein